jgi:Arc/MetJ-type ribon-helix-helix transcriptional regulator
MGSKIMARPKVKDEDRRTQLSITLPNDLVEWLKDLVKDREVATVSFAIEKALLDFRKSRKF